LICVPEPSNGHYRQTETESAFSRVLFLLLIRSLASILEKQPRATMRTPWQSAVYAARDAVRVLSGHIMSWLLSPRHNPRLRLFVVHTLNGNPHCRDLLSATLQSNTQFEHRFSMFFRDLACDPMNKVALTGADARACEALLKSLQSWGMIQQSPRVVPPDPACWSEELTLLHEVIDRQRNTASSQAEAAQIR
jgi:hypothetical protein